MKQIARISCRILLLCFSAQIASAADFGFEMSDQTNFTLIASVRVRNAGAERAEDAVVEMYLPQNLAGQRIFSLDYLPEPSEVKVDRWGTRIGRWKLPPMEPGDTSFVIFVARAASSELRFDMDRLRKGSHPLPQFIRMLYLWDVNTGNEQRSYFDEVQALANYVSRTISQEVSGLPFDVAIPRMEGSLVKALAMTRLAHANNLPCRTIAAYAGTRAAAFEIDSTGRAWNDIYFPQAGWVPMIVSEPREFGRKRNDCLIVRMAGHTDEDSVTFWGDVTGGALLEIQHRGYFSRPRRAQQDRDLIDLFKKMHELGKQEIMEKFSGLGPGSSLALGLLEPYLYHKDAEIVMAAAGAIRSIGQERAVVMIVDAMTGKPESDAALSATARALTGQDFGTDHLAWRAFTRERYPTQPNR